MHGAVRDFVASLDVTGTVIEFGSRDINGTIRAEIDDRCYFGFDLEDGPNVDLAVDVTTVAWRAECDWVLCLEVLEHAPDPRAVCAAARDALKPGGRFAMTCATDPREPHSGVDGGPVRDGEHYRNVEPAVFELWVHAWGDIVTCVVDRDAGDLCAVVVKR